MSPSELARLQMAKRAYQATQPRAVEVQAGVRRARLWLGRPKRRRHWLSKGLVFVVLALGSLAYAKPNAFSGFVPSAMRPSPPLPAPAPLQGRTRLATPSTPAAVASLPAFAPATSPAPPVTEPTTLHTEIETPVTETPAISKTPVITKTPVTKTPVTKTPVTKTSVADTSVTKTPTNTPVTESSSSALSQWGRVGRALAQGDDAGALSALAELSEAADPSTRAKADLGRAQLLMASNQEDQACAVARSLLARNVGSQIERQARALLKTCPPR